MLFDGAEGSNGDTGNLVLLHVAVPGSLYVGMTNNVAVRVEKHNRGLGPEFTKRRRPVELIWSQEFSDRFAARGREVELKGWSRKKKSDLAGA